MLQFDAVLVERVFYNLLENAGKYTHPGTSINISAHLIEDHVDIAISDQGPGLPSGNSNVLFEKFTRGERETTISGVGLGLAICRAIIEAHHGHIRAQNNSQNGACFIFSLPLGEPPEIGTDSEILLGP